MQCQPCPLPHLIAELFRLARDPLPEAFREAAEHRELEGVFAMPGESFGTGGAGHLRVALTVDEGQITEVCKRIVRLAEKV